MSWSVECVARVRKKPPASAVKKAFDERQAEFVDEGPVHVLRQLRDGTVEAEPRLDRHGEKVEGIGELGPDAVIGPLLT